MRNKTMLTKKWDMFLVQQQIFISVKYTLCIIKKNVNVNFVIL